MYRLSDENMIIMKNGSLARRDDWLHLSEGNISADSLGAKEGPFEDSKEETEGYFQQSLSRKPGK